MVDPRGPVRVVRRGRPRRRVAAVASGLLALGALGACGDDGPTLASDGNRFVALDGSARAADDQGVVTDIDPAFANLTIDGERVYEIHPEVQSFASADGSTQPLRNRRGQYVHVGLDGDTVIWVAGIGAVIRVDGQPENVLYLGRVASYDGDEIVLEDGTVLAAAAELALPAVGDPGGPRELPAPATLRIGVSEDAVYEVAFSDPVPAAGG